VGHAHVAHFRQAVAERRNAHIEYMRQGFVVVLSAVAAPGSPELRFGVFAEPVAAPSQPKRIVKARRQ